ncbi:DUF3379 family protein [Thiosocius teredinicola]|uniref:DUF3379 family protein n=1 Tax=Thiosocius teredinicola TaxID=1973002 RepID=UPI000990CE11
MNCLDFRRRLLADPFCDDEELLAHEETCPDCAPFARETRAQEIALRNLLQEVTPPEGLAERIQLAARYEHRVESKRRWWYAAAASMLLTIGVSLFSVWHTIDERSDLSLAQSVLNHIDDESNHLREAQPVSNGRLKFVFDRFDAELAGDLGQVNFAAECPMRHRTGVHLVMPGKMGPITVFFMPGEDTDGVLPIVSDRFQGEITPTAWGSIAVVGESGERLDGMGEALADAVRWPANAGELASALFERRLSLGPRVAQQQDR